MSAVPRALCLYRPPSFPLYLPNLQDIKEQKSPIQCTVQYWAAPWYSRPGQHLGGFYTAVWTLMSILCLVVFCWSGSRTALQCNISSFCKTQLTSWAAFWAPALAGVITFLQRPRTQPLLDLLVFLHIPVTRNHLQLSCAVLRVGVNMSGHLAIAWPFLLMSVGQNRMKISLSFSPRFVTSWYTGEEVCEAFEIISPSLVFSFPLFCSQTICRKNMFRNHLYISAGEFFCLEKWNNTFLQLLIVIPHLCCPPNFKSICALASSLMSSYDRTISFPLKGYLSLSLCKVSENHCTLPPPPKVIHLVEEMMR